MSSWVASKKSSSSRSALSSCWIRRLRPPGLDSPPPSHVATPIPFHLKPRFPPRALNNVPLPVPPPPRQEVDVVRSSEIVAGFGPFRVLPSNSPCPPPLAEACSLLQHRRRLTTGNLGNNTQQEDDGRGESRFASDLRRAHELIGEPPSQLPPVGLQVAATSSSVAPRQGHASRGKDNIDDNHPVATARNFYNRHAFDLNAVQYPSERQSGCHSSEPEEPFSYWDMGRLERRNFVCSVYPATSSPITVSRKRTANTQGCFPAKFGRFCSEG